jgi:hypothetical protein
MPINKGRDDKKINTTHKYQPESTQVDTRTPKIKKIKKMNVHLKKPKKKANSFFYTYNIMVR